MSELCPIAVSEVPSTVQNQPQTLQDANCLMLKEKKYCDVTFTFPNLPDRIEAHQLYLKARSPVFEQIFRLKKSGNVLGNQFEISESSPQRFQEFLEFIYMDKFEVNAAGALDLLPLAKKYQVQALMIKCDELLTTEIKKENSVQVFETARRYGRHELVDRAGEIMVKSLAYLIENDELVNAEEGTVIYLLKRDDLPVIEVELFQLMLKWGKNQVLPSDGENALRDALGKVIPLIRYTNMTPYDFSAVVLPTRLLPGEDIITVYSYIAGDELMRKNMKIKFNITPRNSQAFVDFYAGNEDASPRTESTDSCPLRQCLSFRIQVLKKSWSDYVLKKPAISGIKVKWPSRSVAFTLLADTALDFTVFIKDCSGRVNDRNVQLRFQKHLLNCKDGEEAEIPVEPAVELAPGLTYCIIVEDQSKHNINGYGFNEVKYTYSGVFSPYGLSPEAIVNLGGIDLELKEIKKDSGLSGFYYSSANFLINVIRGIQITMV